MRQATARSAALTPWTGSSRAASSGRSRAQVTTSAALGRASSPSRTDAGAVTSRPLSWLMAAVRASGGTAARRPQRPDGLHDAVASLGRCGGHTGQHRAGGGLSVDRSRLATLAASTPVRPVDLHDVDPTVEQQPGQASAVAAAAFHPDRLQLPVPAQPAQQLPITATVSGELPVTEQPSLLVDNGGVVGAA